MIVHQVLSGAGPFDAVTRQALAFRERFRAWGWGGRDVAAMADPRMDGRVAPLAGLEPAPDDLLLVHWSAYAPGLRRLLALPNRMLLLSHNVTPAQWLWGHDARTAVQCALGRRMLPVFAERAELVAGVSAFNAREAGSERVLPILLEPRDHFPSPPEAKWSREAPVLLFVGRLAPHKRQDELVRVLAALRARRAPGARLVLVGEPLNAAYGAALRDLAERAGPGAVEIVSGISDGELRARYAQARAFVCLSEHEGFCIPLLEAFAAGVPVVARPSGGIPEVAGDAALLAPDRDPAVLAELVWLACADGELREELRARGRARLRAYAPDAVAARMRAAIEELASRPLTPARVPPASAR
ncbi:MAG TPA: glycosyltransferase [Solirubrobacteraceae bacterium]|nr:glycosyltransferase [Solirubrobacteraceae bacterium]